MLGTGGRIYRLYLVASLQEVIQAVGISIAIPDVLSKLNGLIIDHFQAVYNGTLCEQRICGDLSGRPLKIPGRVSESDRPVRYTPRPVDTGRCPNGVKDSGECARLGTSSWADGILPAVKKKAR